MEDRGQTKGAKLHRTQTDLVLLESDFRKNERAIEELELDMKKLKKQRTQLDFDIEEKEKQIKKIQDEQMILTDEIKQTKHKMNLL